MSLTPPGLRGWIAAAIAFAALPLARGGLAPAGPCAAALEKGAVCEAANNYALERMKEGGLAAIMVIQHVQTGALVTFAASDPAQFDVTTALPPLSPVKLIAAASALDQPDMKIIGWPDREKLLNDSIVSGNDNAGRQLASDLRTTSGRDTVLQDLERYGFPPRHENPEQRETAFWAELADRWRDRLTPATIYHSLGQEVTLNEWADTLSLGEERFLVTALHLSRFLQAVGNGGVMLPPVARAEESNAEKRAEFQSKARRVMSASAALELQKVMKGTVEGGTAKSAKVVFADTGWIMGGKTGTGPDPGTKAVGPRSDGCFAGLIFDPQGIARFTVVTYVRRGGLGGGNAARISAELGVFLSGARSQAASH